MQKLSSLIGPIALAVVMSGCATTGSSTANVAPMPSDYQAQVRDHIKRTFFDPYSLRDVSIAEPVIADMVFDGLTPFPRSGWIVCIEANGKNRFGGYTGIQQTAILFNEGKIDISLQTPNNAVQRFCAGAKYKPFNTEFSKA